jgi:hypothetical protein
LLAEDSAASFLSTIGIQEITPAPNFIEDKQLLAVLGMVEVEWKNRKTNRQPAIAVPQSSVTCQKYV